MNTALRALVFIVLIIAVLHIAEPVLMPLAVAAVLAMLFMPLSKRMENKGAPRLFAAIVCVLCFILVLAVIGSLLSWQISTITDDFSLLKRNISHALTRVQQYMVSHLGIARSQQNQLLIPQQTDATEVNKTITSAVGSAINAIVYLLLIVVYMTMLLYFRTHFKNFILKLVPAAEQEKATKIIAQSSHVVQEYLSGLAIVVCFLWISYSIGFTIVGIKNPLFFAILCGLLEVIPFVGNITGSTLTSLMALSQGGGFNMVFGVLATYGIIQFLQFNIVSPMVMAAEVSINPIFTIAGIIAGEMAWGIPGMIIAIPLLGIVKIICDNIEPLKPYGYLIGQERTGKRRPMLLKLKDFFMKKKK